jgi:purine-cytosine permease-like protein
LVVLLKDYLVRRNNISEKELLCSIDTLAKIYIVSLRYIVKRGAKMKKWASILGVIIALVGVIFLIPGFYFDLFGLNLPQYVVAIILIAIGGLLVYYSTK